MRRLTVCSIIGIIIAVINLISCKEVDDGFVIADEAVYYSYFINDTQDSMFVSVVCKGEKTNFRCANGDTILFMKDGYPTNADSITIELKDKKISFAPFKDKKGDVFPKCLFVDNKTRYEIDTWTTEIFFPINYSILDEIAKEMSRYGQDVWRKK